ncbi:putative iron-uptake ABC transport system periplasmic iron-binding protein [Halobacteriovorax marinus SJ]|uniref:Iron-uptake ABC transport system periplasmic iron-binding protein n=1 Tax=Halobacteriovorax marinus (strain ATCC BAA-682 / DSM 15412 / SJ) TaxID=862908 RepID=E1X2W2_HALMS|nr:extracellular solute-binding protein [Halobacteriovorax marinus]CBW25157.1 putative iron-uptake ABC transport system periplasmic iron-binding protein [Halobacteriovorax marinus SJ]
MNMTLKTFLLAFVLFSTNVFAAKSLTIYSVYPGDQLQAVFKPFTERTGIEIKVVSGKSKDLIKRIKEEGVNTEADLHLDKDLAYHTLATNEGIYQPFNSKLVEKNVPANFIETNKNWFTIFYRSRLIMYNKNTVSRSELSTYSQLASKKWQGRLCVRTSGSSYTQSLAASVVAHNGEEKALEIFKGWVRNLSMEVTSSDRDMIRAIAAGKCDVALVNSYYLVPFIEENPDYPVRPFFANQGSSNAHVNGVGIGIVKHSTKLKEATMLLEYLSSAEVQAPVANAFNQYPVNPKAQISAQLQDFGSFNVDSTNVGTIGNLIESAKRLMKEAQYK